MKAKQKNDFIRELVKIWAWDTIIIMLIIFGAHLMTFAIKDYIDVSKISLIVKDFIIAIFIFLLYLGDFIYLLRKVKN